MRLEQACEPTFARHETFHPRFSWFRKSFIAAATDHQIFNQEDATVRLGVGKNMVRSLRFWGTAAHFIADQREPEQPRISTSRPTNAGVAFLGPSGLDPYMEDDATWWWLHWLLLSPGSRLPVWWIILNELSLIELDEATLELACEQTLEASTWNAPNKSSINKDISAFLRTYGTPSSTRGKFDDQFGCPLRDLGLLAPSPAGGHRLATSQPTTLPATVVVAALLDYAVLGDTTANTVSLARLATEAGAPGRAFRLTDAELVDMAESVVDQVDELTLTSPAGAPQLGWRGDPVKIAEALMASYYDHAEPLPPLVGHQARQVNADPLVALQLGADARKTMVS
ncbi:MAG: DUF4007 family protein [Ilumatobacter sp.]|nr:DUF4007 family protein [Ilumatobacter sp.]